MGDTATDGRQETDLRPQNRDADVADEQRRMTLTL